MNIAVTGPEKFAFQDMVCVEIALALRNSGPFTLIPEPEGGEDARLVWSGQCASILEVQVKGAAGTTTIEQLADHLAHYPAHQDRPSLLGRLMDEEHLYSNFILTARCGDGLVELLAAGNRVAKPQPRAVSRRLAESLRGEVRQRAARLLSEKLTPLKRRRAAEQEELALRPIDDFERALAKLFIVERETAETIEVRLHSQLQRERFESSAIRGILARLSDEIGKAKRTQEDVVPALEHVLRKYAPTKLRPPDYLERGIESALVRELQDQGCVLLAGPPRAGKSWTALDLASRLQSDGIEARVGSHVDEANRYLSDNIEARRAYVLDDPIGSREPMSKASATLAEIGQLCARLRSGRYLIVVQTENVLLQARGTDELSDCRLGAFGWTSMSLLSASVAANIWIAEATAQNLTSPEIQRVASLIEASDLLREPGALAHLAQTWSQLPPAPTDQEILAQARRDAVDFARSLAEQRTGARDLMVAAAIGTELARPIGTQDLAFLISGGSERPGFANELEAITIREEESIPAPAYEESPELHAEYVATLDMLQRRRVLAADGEAYNFTHPYLRAGAQALTIPDIPPDRLRLMQQLERALACPSPVTSLAAAENLRWMRPAFQQREVDKLFALARKGMRSRFPATRDSCFEFLVQFAEQLPESMRDELPGLAEDMIVSLDTIEVRAGIGFISNRYDWFSERPKVQEISPYLEALDSGKPLSLDLALSKRILEALERQPEALTRAAVLRLLRADEAIVRSSAAKLWVSVHRSDDDDILDLIAADRTPSMSAGLVESLGRVWSELGVSRRWRLASIIENQIESASCASVVYSRLVLFNRKEEFGANPPWDLFAKLMPKALSHVPFSVSLRNGRLNSAVDDALKVLEPSKLLPLLDAWTQRIVSKVHTRFLDEYELSVTAPLMALERDSARYQLVARLLAVPDTGLRIVTLAALIRDWTSLSEGEQKLVIESLLADKVDTLWLKAIALTRRVVPGELLTALGFDPNALDQESASIEELLGHELFAACFYVHCGWPQPLWWYGTHHASDVWDRATVELATRADHPLHPAALVEVVSHKRDLAVEVIEAVPLDALPAAYAQLLDLQAGTNAEWRPELWRALVGRLLEIRTIDELVAAIDPLVEGIFDRVTDVRAWLSGNPLDLPVRQLMIQDVRGWHALHQLDSALKILDSMDVTKDGGLDEAVDGVRKKLFEAFVRQLEVDPPRLHGTWSNVQQVLKALGCPESLLLCIEQGRHNALENHQRVRDQQTGWPAEPVLTGWLDASSNNS